MLALDRALDDDGGGGALLPLDGASSPLRAAADDGADDASTASAEPEEEEDDDDWEDVGDEPAFRDLTFLFAAANGGGDDDDSDYAPSADGDKDDDDDDDDDDDALQLSDLEVEEEEASPAGLFASVLRRVGGRRWSVDDTTASASTAFEEQDARFWRSAEEKQQWAVRFHAANAQHERAFGCRIDAPALPEATAALRREKRAKSAYALVLFALCVAYLVQLVATYAATTGVVLSAQEVAEALGEYVRALPPPSHMYQRVLERLSPPSDEAASADSPASHPPSPQEPLPASSSGEGDVAVESSELLVEERDVVTSDAAVEQAQSVEATERAEVEGSASDSRAGDANTLLAAEEPQAAVPVGSEVGAAEPEPASPPVADKASESEHATLAVQLCSKFVTRLVKSKYDQMVKDAALRACDAAVALAPLATALGVEAHVLRGDLWSLVSAFSSADDDYSAAVSSAFVQPALAQQIELKALANRWIRLFTQHSYKQLRQDAGRVAKDAGASAALRALAADWLLVFRKKKQPFEVLTSTRLWTLQRLEYA